MRAKNTSIIKATIVAIDDSPMILKFLTIYLEKEYEVHTYDSTLTALQHLSEGHVTPDCILTDFNLGNDLTGLQFTKELKKIDPIIPVLILSGSCDIDTKIKCLQEGAVDFVNKPFNPKELVARIQKALSISPQLNQYRDAI